LADHFDQAVALGIDLQLVDGLGQIEFAGGPQHGAGLTPSGKDGHRIETDGDQWMADGGAHGAAPPLVEGGSKPCGSGRRRSLLFIVPLVLVSIRKVARLPFGPFLFYPHAI
jgi:hypothetical protein